MLFELIRHVGHVGFLLQAIQNRTHTLWKLVRECVLLCLRLDSATGRCESIALDGGYVLVGTVGISRGCIHQGALLVPFYHFHQFVFVL